MLILRGLDVFFTTMPEYDPLEPQVPPKPRRPRPRIMNSGRQVPQVPQIPHIPQKYIFLLANLTIFPQRRDEPV